MDNKPKYRGFNTPYVPNAMDDRKLAITAPPVEGGKMPASFRITFPNGNPRAVCDMGPGIPSVSGKMDMFDFFRLLEMVRKIAATVKECHLVMKLKAPAVDENGQRVRGAPVHVASIEAGRTSKGRIFISVKKADSERAPARFYFGQSQFGNITEADGTPIPDEVLSSESAIAWCNMYQQLIPAAHLHTFKPREKNEGGNGGGQAQRHQTPPKADEFDEDIPY